MEQEYEVVLVNNGGGVVSPAKSWRGGGRIRFVPRAAAVVAEDWSPWRGIVFSTRGVGLIEDLGREVLLKRVAFSGAQCGTVWNACVERGVARVWERMAVWRRLGLEFVLGTGGGAPELAGLADSMGLNEAMVKVCGVGAALGPWPERLEPGLHLCFWGRGGKVRDVGWVFWVG